MGAAPPLRSPLQGVVCAVLVAVDDVVRAGTAVIVIESMKMEHVVVTERDARVAAVLVDVGDSVKANDELLRLDDAPIAHSEDEPTRESGAIAATNEERSSETERADLAAVIERHEIGLDERRPEAVARRRAGNRRTARENIADLIDEGSFVEYGPLVIAAERRRRAVEELIERTPADGLVGGLATIDGRPVVVMSYDYMVLAGTQGAENHRKKDRLFELVGRLRVPLVFFTEGGGGRPGDTDAAGVSGLDTMAFHLFAKLSGLVPLVGIASGRCFAGNAALLGCCDVIIATPDANIGMGGPAMIEGGGLGVVTPDEIGPMSVQVPNGVVDVLAQDEGHAVAIARQYLSYFATSPPKSTADPGTGTGTGTDTDTDTAIWSCTDQALLRDAIPENRRRPYDVRALIEVLADTGSTLELRAGFGSGIVTALAKVEGRAIGVVANNPAHLGGAIDADGADKAARFLQLCDAHDVAVLYLCDTPGIMVGPEVETTALVRHVNRLFLTGANLSVPYVTIITRKAYGLGAQAMAGGSLKAPLFCVAWPTGELGGMGLEGAVTLGFRRELQAIEDEDARRALFDDLVERAYEHGKALNTASHFEIDDVIDPAESRRWITAALSAAGPPAARVGKRRPNIDAW